MPPANRAFLPENTTTSGENRCGVRRWGRCPDRARSRQSRL